MGMARAEIETISCRHSFLCTSIRNNSMKRKFFKTIRNRSKTTNKTTNKKDA